jgi:putative aldouronate transport system permease protein
MYGLRIAFMDYSPYLGFAKSKWAGLKHFRNFFANPMSWAYIGNTLHISIVSFIFGYPIPIILALMFNALPLKQTRKLIQSIFYMLNFVSVVVTVGMLQLFIASVSSPNLVFNGKVLFLPHGSNLDGFRRVFNMPDLWRGYLNTIYYIAVGTAINLAMTMTGAFALSRKN